MNGGANAPRLHRVHASGAAVGRLPHLVTRQVVNQQAAPPVISLPPPQRTLVVMNTRSDDSASNAATARPTSASLPYTCRGHERGQCMCWRATRPPRHAAGCTGRGRAASHLRSVDVAVAQAQGGGHCCFSLCWAGLVHAQADHGQHAAAPQDNSARKGGHGAWNRASGAVDAVEISGETLFRQSFTASPLPREIADFRHGS